MKVKNLFNPQRILILVGVGITLAIPLIFNTSQYVMLLMTTVLLYAILASAWNIIGGMAGQLDLAAAAYLGLGAFTTGTLLIRWNITPWVGMFLGGLVATALAMLIGFPLFGFKVKELWYALSSSALVVVLQSLFMMWNEVGGPTEKYLPVGTSPWYSMRFNDYMPYYYIMVIMLVLVLLVNRWIRYSKLGYSLLALGEDEDAVEVLGVNSQSSKLKALAIYAYICGVVGGVFACIYGYVHPAFFDTSMSMEITILGIVGGMGFIYGPALAAIIMVSFREVLRASLGSQLAGLYLAVYAIILIVVALYQPRGIAPLIERGIKKAQTYFVELTRGRRADFKSH